MLDDAESRTLCRTRCGRSSRTRGADRGSRGTCKRQGMSRSGRQPRNGCHTKPEAAPAEPKPALAEEIESAEAGVHGERPMAPHRSGAEEDRADQAGAAAGDEASSAKSFSEAWARHREMMDAGSTRLARLMSPCRPRTIRLNMTNQTMRTCRIVKTVEEPIMRNPFARRKPCAASRLRFRPASARSASRARPKG